MTFYPRQPITSDVSSDLVAAAAIIAPFIDAAYEKASRSTAAGLAKAVEILRDLQQPEKQNQMKMHEKSNEVAKSFYASSFDETEEFVSLDDAIHYCKEAISYAKGMAETDGEWPTDMDSICIREGKPGLVGWEEQVELPVIYKATEIDISRPSSPLDEDGYDSEGNFWSGPGAYACDYDILPVLE